MAQARQQLNSLTDIQRAMATIYRENRTGKISDTHLSAMSQHLTRLHNMKISEKELDINADLLAIEGQLAELEKSR